MLHLSAAGYRLRVVFGLSLFLVCCLLPLQSVAQDPPDADTAISLAYCNDCIPFQFTNDAGEPDGIIMDYWKLWSEKTGTPIRYTAAGWNDAIDLVREGKADVHAGLGFNDERDEFLEYGVRLSDTTASLFFNKSISIPQQILDIKAYRIGVLAGDKTESYLKSALPAASVIAFPSYEEIMEALRSGDLMVFAADTPTGMYHLTKSGLFNDFHFDTGQSLYNSPWYVASAEGNTGMVLRVNKGMERISRDERKAIVRRWASVDRDMDPNAVIIPYMASYPPLMMLGLDGKPTGYLIDLWKLWSEKTGTPIRFKQATWKETLSSVRRGETDLHPGLFKSESRETWMAFTAPVMDVRTALYFRVGKDKAVPLSDMKGRRVGVMGGSYQEQFIKDKYPHVITVPYLHNEAMVIGLLKGEIDALVNEEPTVEADLSRFSLHGAVRRYKECLFRNTLHGGVLKQNAALLKKINEGLAAIPEEEKAALERRWFPYSEERFYASPELDDGSELTAAEMEWIRNNPVIRVGVTSFIDPVDRLDKNGRYTGLNADIIGKLNSYMRINLAPVFHDAWEDVVKDAFSGKTDCVMSFSRTPEREEHLFFTEPYALDPVIVVVRDHDDSIQDWKDLKGKTVSVVKGASMFNEVKSEVDTGKVVGVADEAQGLDLLGAGKVDAHVSWLIPYGNAQRAREVPNLRVALRRASETGTLRIGVHKSQPELYSILRKGLKHIPAADMEEIRVRWLDPPNEKQKPSVVLGKEEARWLADRTGPVIVGAEMDWPPFDFTRDGVPTGYSNELLRLAAAKAGLPIEFVSGHTWAGLLEKFEKREIDILPALYKTPARAKAMALTTSYATNPQVLVVRDDVLDINEIGDLSGRKLAIPEGFSTAEYILEQHSEIEAVLVPNVLEGLKAVSLRKADAFTGSLGVISHLLKENLIPNIRIIDEIVLGDLGATMLHMASAKDQTVLRDILQKGLDAVTAKEKNELREEWLFVASAANGPADKVELTPEESAWIASRTAPVVVGAETDWPPFDFVADGEATGFSNDLVRLAAKKTGLPIEFVFGFTWNELVDKFRSGEIDMLPVIYNTEERRREMALTEHYATNPQVLVVNESIKGAPTLKQLAGKKVAVMDGSTLSTSLTEQFPDLELVSISTPLEGLKAVSLGKADAYIDSLGPIAYLLKENYLPSVRIVDEVWLKGLDASMLHIGVKKDQAILRDIMQKGLDAVSGDEKNELRSQWLGLDQVQGRRAMVKLSSEERAWLDKAPPLRMSVDPNWLPIEKVNKETGEYEGIAAEYVSLISDVTGLKFELVPTEKWAESVKLAESGKTDLLVACSKTKEREEFLDFSLPYITLSNAVVMRNDAPFVNDIRDLVGMRVGVGDGNAMHRYLQKNHPDLTLVPNKGTFKGLMMVANGEVDAYVGTLEVMGYLINQNGMFNLKVALKLPMERELHMAVRKDVAPEALSIINKALESVTPEEESSIFRKWISLRVEEKFDFTLIYKIGLPVGGVILLIIGIITVWNRKLSHEIEERKVVEEALRNSEEEVKNILATAEEGFWRIDNDAATQDVNQKMLEILGRTREEVLGLALFDFLDEENQQVVREQLKRRARDESGSYDLSITRPDGSQVPTIFSASPLYGKDGVKIGSFGMVSDITKRKKVEAQLQDAFGVITSSIKYASRIQRSVLPPATRIEGLTSDHFVTWEPRDVVGGDMYWCELWGEGSVVILGDCTGHGVPGAFMTLLATGALKRALAQVPAGDPAGLLSAMHRSLQKQLGQHVQCADESCASDDGLELGVCYLAPDNNIVTYAGARMPLFVDHGGSIEIVKGAKKGIAYRGIPHDFEYTNTVIDIKDETGFFMISDGILDQIGGPKRRGFGKKRFLALLASLDGLSMQEKGKRLYEELLAYQGDEKRRDDISAVGFKI